MGFALMVDTDARAGTCGGIHRLPHMQPLMEQERGIHHAMIPIPAQSLAGDSCSVADQRIGPASSVNEIVRFGKRAQVRFGEVTREGFYGIIDTI
jgi:hypothetical protein